MVALKIAQSLRADDYGVALREPSIRGSSMPRLRMEGPSGEANLGTDTVRMRKGKSIVCVYRAGSAAGWRLPSVLGRFLSSRRKFVFFSGVEAGSAVKS